MRVVHLNKTSVGAAWALRQTKELVALGYEIHMIMPNGPMVEKFEAAGVCVHQFDYGFSLFSPLRLLKKLRQFREIIEKINPDVIHSHFVLTTLFMRLSLRKNPTPRIFHVPGPLHLEHFVFRNLELGLAQSQDYWLASCLWTRRKYESSGIAPERIGLAYYGVDESDFTFSDATDGVGLREQLGLEQETKLVAMVAYYYPPKRYLGQKRGLKGHEDLIDAMRIVKQSREDIHCVFIGGPWNDAQWYMDEVVKYGDSLDNLSFLGYRNDVPSLYRQFDLAVHPSHSENVGGAVESMYADVATLTSDVGGFPDLVEDGETGYMAKAKDPKHLAHKILEALENENERNRRVENAAKKVRQVMNVKQNAVQISEFYRVVEQNNEKVV